MIGQSVQVSVIVPCYNEARTIGYLLSALTVQDFPLDHLEVIISDGMSTDNTRSIVADFGAVHPEIDIRVIDNPQRIIPAALNRAIEATKGEYIVRLDAHSIPSSSYLKKCVELLHGRGAANVGGIWEIKPGGDHWIARGIAAAAAHPLGAGAARYRIGGPPGPVDTVPFGAFHRSWLERIGPFDESLLTNEDYEYNVRIRNAGGEVYFDPGIKSIYLARPDLVSLARQYARYGYWKARMLKRYPTSVRLRQLLPPAFVLSLVFQAILAPFAALFQALLAVELGVYTIITLALASAQAWKRKDFGLPISFPVAILTMHISWGTGFLVGISRALLGRRA